MKASNKNNQKQVNQFFKSILLNACDNEGYNDQVLETEKEKIQFLKDTFYSELGFRVDQVGLQKACLDWLQGLASACTIPFYNSEIIKLLENEFNVRYDTDDKCHSEVDWYWKKAAIRLSQLFTNGK